MRVDLDELEQLEKAATPGPWKGCPSPNAADTFSSVRPMRDGRELEEIANTYGSTNFEERSNAFFIAAARNALPSLIAELRAARHVVNAARPLVKAWRNFEDPNGIYERSIGVKLDAYDRATKGDG